MAQARFTEASQGVLESGVGDAQHLVGALLEFVGDAGYYRGVALRGEFFEHGGEVWRTLVRETWQEGEDARLFCHAAQLADGIEMEFERERIRVGEQKMRAERQIEFAVAKGKRRQFRRAVAPFADSGWEIFEKAVHGLHANLT